jgi:hypothetical protein
MHRAAISRIITRRSYRKRMSVAAYHTETLSYQAVCGQEDETHKKNKSCVKDNQNQ